MKLLTLNTHSLQEPDYLEKLARFAWTILELRPDLIAMQEVNQTMTAPPAPPELLEGYVPAAGHQIPLLADNHAMHTAHFLRNAGVRCSWTWLPVKRGYGKYDEGLALLSLGAPISDIDVLRLSCRDDYEDWRTRKALGVRLEGKADWFYSIHTGWWADAFREQWEALEQGVSEKRRTAPVWLLGDLNAPPHVKGESYDLIQSSGWADTYALAEERDDGITMRGPIDGWEDQRDGLRIDYILCSEAVSVASSQVVFNGVNGPVVSDHFGILAEIKEEPR